MVEYAIEDNFDTFFVSGCNEILPWIDHIKEIGCTALYIGPLFESVGHGYETTDYRKLDSRLGDNKDLKNRRKPLLRPDGKLY